MHAARYQYCGFIRNQLLFNKKTKSNFLTNPARVKCEYESDTIVSTKQMCTAFRIRIPSPTGCSSHYEVAVWLISNTGGGSFHFELIIQKKKQKNNNSLLLCWVDLTKQKQTILCHVQCIRSWWNIPGFMNDINNNNRERNVLLCGIVFLVRIRVEVAFVWPRRRRRT